MTTTEPDMEKLAASAGITARDINFAGQRLAERLADVEMYAVPATELVASRHCIGAEYVTEMALEGAQMIACDLVRLLRQLAELKREAEAQGC